MNLQDKRDGQITLNFDGPTFEPEKDAARLGAQLVRVLEFMESGHWATLKQIAAAAGCSEASASARLRDLRKPKFGGRTVERRRVDGGLFEYRLKIGTWGSVIE